jgi:hypothetical protein
MLFYPGAPAGVIRCHHLQIDLAWRTSNVLRKNDTEQAALGAHLCQHLPWHLAVYDR